ncbi:MAG: hypothetical protein ABIR11_10635 [Candidatus Limnocylindrales bacterium]
MSTPGTDGTRTNGHVPSPDTAADEAALDALDEEPLDPSEAAAGAAVADEAVDESLDERIEAVVADLGSVERRRASDGVAYAVGGRVFAVLGDDRLETALDPAVAKAALRTADTRASSRGAGWIEFTPGAMDRFALDRAEAWVRSAHRRVARR